MEDNNNKDLNEMQVSDEELGEVTGGFSFWGFIKSLFGYGDPEPELTTDSRLDLTHAALKRTAPGGLSGTPTIKSPMK